MHKTPKKMPHFDYSQNPSTNKNKFKVDFGLKQDLSQNQTAAKPGQVTN
jgi:hypothetical protein